MTPLANNKEEEIILSSFLIDQKIGITPSIVEKPAKEVIKKLMIIEFIVKYM